MKSGIRVVDCGRVLSAPFAAQVFVDLGADVIKIESPEGDRSRQIGPFVKGRSTYFASVNSGKRGVSLDLVSRNGRIIFERILESTDVLIHNFRPSTAESLGLSPHNLSELFPDLIVVAIVGYSSTSDRGKDPAYDVATQAESGIVSLTGRHDDSPVRVGVPIVDLVTGLYASIAALNALFEREVGGRGTYVEVPMLDSALTLLSYLGVGALATGAEPGVQSSSHQSEVPYGIFKTMDGWLAVAVIGDGFWPRLCQALDLPRDWQKRYATSESRLVARCQIDEVLGAQLQQMPTKEAATLLLARGVPHAPVLGVLDALTSRYVERRRIVGSATWGDATLPYIRGPFASREDARRVPEVGEDNALLGFEV